MPFKFARVYSAETAIDKTTQWYRAFYNGNTDMVQFTKSQLDEFIQSAKDKYILWSK